MPTRHDKQREQDERIKRERQRRVMLAIGAGVAIVLTSVIVLFSGVLNLKPAETGVVAGTAVATPTCEPVQSFSSQGQTHITQGQSHPPYNSNPPTSGWHLEQSRGAGIFNSPQVQELLVHDLEHGFVIIQYNGLTSAELTQLTEMVQRDRYHRILAPYPQLPEGARVALTAWTKLQLCNGVSEKDIAAFTSAYRDQGPEKVP